VLDNLGTANYKLGYFEKALAYYRQALVIRQEVGDAKGEFTTLVKIGNVCGQFGQLEEAIGSYEQALTVARTAKLRDQEAAALCSLGAAYNSTGRNQKALEYTEQALRLAREVKDRETEKTCLNNLGSIYSDLGRYDKALQYYEQALAMRRETRDRFGEGTTLGNMGTTFQHLGQFKKAVECYQQALAIARELKDRAGEAAALSNLGAAYSNLDQTQKAIECHEQALAIRREVKDPAGEASTLNNLGGAYASLGKFQKAIPYFERALKIQRQVKDRQGVVALQTIVGRDKYRVILITPDTIKQGEYPITRSELERKVGTFCAELRDPRSDPLPLAQELYKILIGPVAEELEDAQAQTLMWSLDGKLRYLPISALHDGEKYMVERYRSVIFTLASRPRLKDTPTLKSPKPKRCARPRSSCCGEAGARGVEGHRTLRTSALLGAFRLDRQLAVSRNRNRSMTPEFLCHRRLRTGGGAVSAGVRKRQRTGAVQKPRSRPNICTRGRVRSPDITRRA
jgi:tetratricopeptide (TPR) repeat protein